MKLDIDEKVKFSYKWLFLLAVLQGLFYLLQHIYSYDLHSQIVIFIFYILIFVFVLSGRLLVDICFFRITTHLVKIDISVRDLLQSCLESMKISSAMVTILCVIQYVIVRSENFLFLVFSMYLVQIQYCGTIWYRYKESNNKVKLSLIVLVYLLLSIGFNYIMNKKNII